MKRELKPRTLAAMITLCCLPAAMLFLAMFCGCSQQKQNAERNYVYLTTNQDKQCSGVAFSKRRVLTAAHCVAGEFYFRGQKGHVLYSDDVVAVIQFDNANFFPSVRLPYHPIRRGDELYSVSNALDLDRASRYYAVMVIRDPIGILPVPYPGESGSGLYDKHGCLVGLAEGYVIHQTGAMVGLMTPHWRFAWLIARYKEER